MSKRVELFRLNVIMQLLSFIAVTVMAFIVTPFILDRVDYAVYGVFALTSSVMIYLRYMEGGLSGGLYKHLSVFIAKKNYSNANKYINTTLLIYGVISIIVLIIGVVLAFTFQYIFNIDPQYILIGRVLFILETILLVFTLVSAPFSVIMNSFQKNYYISFVSFFSEWMRLPILITLFNYLSWSNAFIYYVGIYNLLSIISWIIIIVIFMKKYFPEYTFGFYCFDMKIVKVLFTVSSWFFISQLCELIIDRTDNIVLATIMTVEAVTFYALGSSVVQKARGFSKILLTPLTVVIANVVGSQDQEREEKLLYQGSRLYTTMISSFFIILFIFFEKFILLWVGTDFISSITVGRLLTVYFFLTILTQIPTQFFFFKGIIKLPAVINLSGAVLNLILSIILVRSYGLLGVAWGTLLPQLLFVFPASLWLIKYAGFGLGRFFMRVIVRVIPFLSFSAIFSVGALYLSDKYLTVINNVWYLFVYLGILYFLLIGFYYIFFCRGDDRDMLWKVAFANNDIRYQLPRFLR